MSLLRPREKLAGTLRRPRKGPKLSPKLLESERAGPGPYLSQGRWEVGEKARNSGKMGQRV